MSDTPNYSTFHLEELEKALSNLDESKNPEEAKVIREYIAKGGYSYPSTPVIDRVVFVSPIYKRLLISFVLIFLSYNFFMLIVWHTKISLLAISLQSAFLSMIFKNHKHVRSVVKIWCVVILFISLFGFLSMNYSAITMTKVFGSLFMLIVGLSFFVLANKSIQLVRLDSNN